MFDDPTYASLSSWLGSIQNSVQFMTVLWYVHWT
jgi:hypothetical protein